jgi:glucose-1-phosphate cytidylyltransferase
MCADKKMKVVILAGGMGTRLAEETELRPKPMIEIGGRPILWHIMKHYSQYGYDEFVIAMGYKGEVIKGFFKDYALLSGSMTIDLGTGQVQNEGKCEDWKVHLMDTGLLTNSGGRVKQLKPLLDGTFMLTYGDGVGSVDLDALLRFHRTHGKLVTLTAVRPPARFGGLEIEDHLVKTFIEKPQIGEGWINGGFMVCEPRLLDYIEGDDTDLARYPLEQLAREGQLAAYPHEGFWQCMDTLRDKRLLEDLWQKGNAPWKTWRE